MNWYARGRILGVAVLLTWIWVLYLTEDVMNLGVVHIFERLFGLYNGIGVWSIAWLVVIACIYRVVYLRFAKR